MNPPKPLPLFETHITVSPFTDLNFFRTTCGELDVKCIAIDLPTGSTPVQPMTSSFHKGALEDIAANARVLAAKLAERGFEIVRTKIELHGRLEDAPASDALAAARPASYFEFHGKLVLPPNDAAVVEAIAKAGGYLSRNAANTNPRERFLTFRAFGLGRANADARFDALVATIARHGVPVRARVREYTVLDSNPALDAGWIGAP